MKIFRELLRCVSDVPESIDRCWEYCCDFLDEPRPGHWLARAVEYPIPENPRPLRVRRVVIVLAGLASVCGVVHVVHGHQIARQASALLTQAGRYEEQQNPVQAVQYLKQYLALQSQDTDALARLALLMVDGATSASAKSEAAILCDRVVAQDPTRDDIRRHSARLWLETGRFAQAAKQAEEICRAHPDDPEISYLLGLACFGQSKYPEAAAAYERAIELGSRAIGPYVALAYLCRDKLDQPNRADELMNAMIAADSSEPMAYEARYRYFLTLGRDEDAGADIQKAVELAPDNAALLAQAAEWALRQQDVAAAIEYANRGAAAHPADARFPVLLVAVYRLQGEPKRAELGVRAGLASNPDDQQLLWHLAELLLDQEALDEAEPTINRLQQLAPNSIHTLYLQARLLRAKGEPIRAAAMFEQAMPRISALPKLAVDAQYHLGECYRSLELWDLALVAYRRSIQLNPKVMRSRLASARVLEQMGLFEDAMNECDKLVALPEFPGTAVAIWARAYLGYQLRRPPAQRSWDRLEEMLRKVETVQPSLPELELVRANYLAARGQREEAAAVLEKAAADHPRSLAIWQALVRTNVRAGAPEEIEQLFARAAQELGDLAELRTAWAGYLATSGRGEQAVTLLEERLRQATDENERIVLLGALVQFSMSKQDLSAARTYQDEIARLRPEDINIQMAVLDLAFAASDLDAIDRELPRLRDQKGPFQTLGQYVEARRLWVAGRGGDQRSLEQAQQLLVAVCNRRPYWSPPCALLGQVAEALGHIANAIDAYTRAQELGDRSPALAQQLVRLLASSGRYVEATAVYLRLADTVALGPEFERQATELFVRSGDWEQAAAAARRSVTAAPNDYRNHLSLGHVLRQAGRSEDAEQPFCLAVALAPQSPETWAMLIEFYAATGRSDAARRTIDEAAARLKPNDAVSALPQFYELAGMNEQAEQQFRAALRAQPNDPSLQTAAANHFMRRGNLTEAEVCLRRTLALRPDSPDARRGLAVIVAAQRAYPNWGEARALIEKNFQDRAPTLHDKRAKAHLLAMRPSTQHVAEAIQLLEEISSSGLLTPGDRQVLGKLYYSSGRADRARLVLRTLLNDPTTDRAQAADAIELLMAQGELNEADGWLKTVESRDEDRRGIPIVILRARWLDEMNRSDEAVRLLRTVLAEHAEDSDHNDLLQQVFVTLNTFHWSEPAEQLHRELAERRPSLSADVAIWLAQRGRAEAALRLLGEVAKLGEVALAASGGAMVLALSDPSAEQIATVEEWHTRAFATAPQSLDLEFSFAVLRHAQGRNEESAAMYRQLLARGANPAVAINNLAWIVGVDQGRPAEALELINQALTKSGPMPNLLDTRGVILTRLGRYDEAIASLTESANARPATDGVCYLNLAHAYSLNGPKDRARAALEKIDSAGPSAALVKAAQRAEYTELKDRLAK